MRRVVGCLRSGVDDDRVADMFVEFAARVLAPSTTWFGGVEAVAREQRRCDRCAWACGDDGHGLAVDLARLPK